MVEGDHITHFYIGSKIYKGRVIANYFNYKNIGGGKFGKLTYFIIQNYDSEELYHVGYWDLI